MPLASAMTQGKLSSAAPSEFDSDLPVDPNEPVYCTCKRVAFGDMIGCDNTNARISSSPGVVFVNHGSVSLLVRHRMVPL